MSIMKLWEQHFPQLTGAGDQAMGRIMESARSLSFPAHQLVSSAGSICDYYLLVVRGSLRVQVLTENGREIVLYHVHPGDGCILTTSCLLSGDPFPAEGITQSATEVLALTATEFDSAMQDSALFRRFVFQMLGQRLVEVITRLEQVSSPAIDQHLAGILGKMNRDNSMTIITTHQELALELGTAREVVSRHLKRFETQGWLRLGRGTIEIKAPEVLARLASK